MTLTPEQFAVMKKDVLGRKDKSQEGKIDERILHVIELINHHEDYCTTSSCSGRVQLIAKKTRRKELANWPYKTHDLADEEGLLEATSRPFEGELWFREEGFILHVRCRTLGAAYALLDAGQKAGFKHSGITGKRNIVLEVRGSDAFDTIVGIDGHLLVERLYLRILTQIANRKMEENWAKIIRFDLNVKRLFGETEK